MFSLAIYIAVISKMQWFGIQESGNQLLKVAVKKSKNRNYQLRVSHAQLIRHFLTLALQARLPNLKQYFQLFKQSPLNRF